MIVHPKDAVTIALEKDRVKLILLASVIQDSLETIVRYHRLRLLLNNVRTLIVVTMVSATK